VTVITVVLGASSRDGSAQEFDEFKVFIEINATDGDAGLQGKLDGEAWNQATVTRPDGEVVFELTPQSNLMEHGVTEIQWESNEPPFTEFPLADFLTRFPAGEYSASAMTVAGQVLMSTATLTHNLPAGPVITAPAEEEVVVSGTDLTVTWEAVTDDFQRPGAGDLASAIVGYVVVVEYEGEETTEVLTLDVPAEETQAIIPGSFLRTGRIYKIEVGAREESGNQTVTEIEVCTDECPEDEE
jgi:hypothetical protein